MSAALLRKFIERSSFWYTIAMTLSLIPISSKKTVNWTIVRKGFLWQFNGKSSVLVQSIDLPGACRTTVLVPASESIRLTHTSTKFLPVSDSYNTRRCQFDFGAGQRTFGAKGRHLNRPLDIYLLNARAPSILKVYPLITALAIGHSSSTAGRNYALSRLDITDRSNSRPQSPATVHPQGISPKHCLYDWQLIELCSYKWHLE